MPRKYDRIIRYYASWFDDLLDPSKEFTAEECWLVITTIRDCQIECSLEPLERLPIAIRRALSMATLGEQIIRMLERSERMRNKGADGGNKAQQNRRTAEQVAASRMRAEKEQQEQQKKEDYYAKMKKDACSLERLDNLYLAGAKGDQAALAELQITQIQCIENARRKGLIK